MGDGWGVGEGVADAIALRAISEETMVSGMQPISEETMVSEPEIIDATMYVSVRSR